MSMFMISLRAALVALSGIFPPAPLPFFLFFVAVMPGSSFGEHMRNWVRLALTIDDADMARALDRICTFAQRRAAVSAQEA